MTGGNHAAHHICVSTAIDQSHDESERYRARAAETKVVKSPVLGSGLKATDDWEPAPRPPSGCELEAVRDFCNISVVALLSVGNRVRFCSVYYTGSVTRINQNCLKK